MLLEAAEEEVLTVAGGAELRLRRAAEALLRPGLAHGPVDRERDVRVLVVEEGADRGVEAVAADGVAGGVRAAAAGRWTW